MFPQLSHHCSWKTTISYKKNMPYPCRFDRIVDVPPDCPTSLRKAFESFDDFSTTLG